MYTCTGDVLMYTYVCDILLYTSIPMLHAYVLAPEKFQQKAKMEKTFGFT